MEAVTVLFGICLAISSAMLIVMGSDNRHLNERINEQQEQITRILDGWGRCSDILHEALDDYERLGDRYRELWVAYERAYKVLEEYELLEEVNGNADDTDCNV